MRQFGHTFFGSVVQDSTFFESCGIAGKYLTQKQKKISVWIFLI